MNNKLLDIQNMLFDEMTRLNNNKFKTEEISRSNALSNSAMAYIKIINLSLRLKESAIKNQLTYDQLKKELGLDETKV